VPILERVTNADPDGVHGQVALGLALVRDSQVERGVKVLRSTFERASERHPSGTDSSKDSQRLAALEGLLAGLDLASIPEGVESTLGNQPGPIKSEPRLLRFQGLAEQQRANWPAAIVAFQGALAFDPSDMETRVRLARALRLAARTDEADTVDREVADRREAA